MSEFVYVWFGVFAAIAIVCGCVSGAWRAGEWLGNKYGATAAFLWSVFMVGFLAASINALKIQFQ